MNKVLGIAILIILSLAGGVLIGMKMGRNATTTVAKTVVEATSQHECPVCEPCESSEVIEYVTRTVTRIDTIMLKPKWVESFPIMQDLLDSAAVNPPGWNDWWHDVRIGEETSDTVSIVKNTSILQQLPPRPMPPIVIQAPEPVSNANSAINRLNFGIGLGMGIDHKGQVHPVVTGGIYFRLNKMRR